MAYSDSSPSLIDRVIRFCLENKIVVLLLMVFIVGWGLMVAPFDWELGILPRDPVPVDAIPDIGENQQIVFTKWMGRSPQDVEDQISYPLTVALLGIPGVKTIRSYSMFGFSSIYIIFDEDIEFYWSRSRILEKLNSLPANTLPVNVRPALGPDATALGQVFWYTLEGRDLDGNPNGGWDLDELRSIQDWYVRYALLSANGISEVASVGGFTREYQIDVDPDAMRAHGVKLDEIYHAIKMSNVDVGARTIEINKAEYVIRGLGFIESVWDIENSVIKVNDNVPIYVKNVAHVSLGPALRRGALDKEGAEVVGGVVVVRYGENPLSAIKNLKKKIEEISPGLPRKTLPDGTISQVTVVPFYDRSGLIYETLGTLNEAISLEILITIIVVLITVMHFRSSLLVSGLLPLAVLMTFIAMKAFKVDANIVALSGIAIAIGTMVDMGIIVCENILKHVDSSDGSKSNLEVIYQATSEVGGAVLTAVSTTIVSFLPVFTMVAAEGKLFKPLAYTKTFALFSSVILALTIIPAFAHLLFGIDMKKYRPRRVLTGILTLAGSIIGLFIAWWLGVFVLLVGVYFLLNERIPEKYRKYSPYVANGIAVLFVGLILSRLWVPLGPERGDVRNFIFVALLIGGLLTFFQVFQMFYPRILRWCLAHKLAFLTIPMALVIFGATTWLGFSTIFGFLPKFITSTRPMVYMDHKFPGLGKEFMPPLDEGSYLYMPTTMPHASIGEALDVLQKLDMAIKSIPEIDMVVGKLGRAETPLDPAPISMIETVINYKPEYMIDENGHRLRFEYDSVNDEYKRDEAGELILSRFGRPYRLWREQIHSANDIWDEIVNSTQLLGTTSAPKLQPIAARIVMLQSGMRAPMGVKVKGPDLETIERVGMQLEKFLKEVPSVEPAAVFADRIVGKPYLEIDIDREAIARFGLKVRQVQDVIEVAIGGKSITMTVEGRERYPVRVRYQRELRDTIEELGQILVAAPGGAQIPLTQLTEVKYIRGPQVIKSEDTFLVGYVLFDMKPGHAEVDVVNDVQDYLKMKMDSGEFQLPAGVSYVFAGSYENQIRSEKKLMVVLPLALFVIFMILYFQFKSIPVTLLIFSGIIVAWSGGFIMIWLYGEPWFLNFEIFGVNMRNLFQMHPINLSVAIWVGFLALFGIATDEGVIIGTFIRQSFNERKPKTIQEIREATIFAGRRRIRPCLMTAATTILALLPVLSSTGRGADIMIPMAIPSFGGMAFQQITLFVVPILYCALEELKLRFK